MYILANLKCLHNLLDTPISKFFSITLCNSSFVRYPLSTNQIRRLAGKPAGMKKSTRKGLFGFLFGCLFCKSLIFNTYCGEIGIRTPGTSQFNGFQDRRNRPLCHLSRTFLQSFSLNCGAKVAIIF